MNLQRRRCLCRIALAVGTSSTLTPSTVSAAVDAAALQSSVAPADARLEPAVLTQAAPGVYVAQGAKGSADAANLGRIGNAGFIVGTEGVVAIDTGTSFAQGVALLQAIVRITDRPVRAVIVTHARQEFLFGAAAYQAQNIPVFMQRRAVGLMRSRCEHCLENLRKLLGDTPMIGSRVVTPDREFDHAEVLALAGRPIELLYFGHSSGPGATAVFDSETRTLFAGGLIDYQRVPDVQDADLDGWQKALEQMQKMQIDCVVPGHGGIAPANAITETGHYLSALHARIIRLLQEGVALSDVPNAATLPEFAHWDQYDPIHRRNASILFVRYERDNLFSEPPSAAAATRH